MKVKLLIKRTTWQGGWPHCIHLNESLPFYWSRAATRAHRVRSATMHYHNGVYSHTSFSAWCGQTGFSSKGKHLRLCDNPPDDLPVCATCEGRAIGAGQLGATTIAGRQVLFTPRREAVEVQS